MDIDELEDGLICPSCNEGKIFEIILLRDELYKEPVYYMCNNCSWNTKDYARAKTELEDVLNSVDKSDIDHSQEDEFLEGMLE